MSDPSKISHQPMLLDLDNDISSPASADGPTPSDSPASPTTPTYGPGRARASHSRARGRGAVFATLDIFGRHGSHSSSSVALQSSLESRLRARTDSRGSTLFALTWSDAVTPLGRRICALRASGRRTSGSGCTSWPTPTTQDSAGSARHGYADDGRERAAKDQRRATLTGHAGTTLTDAARLAGWPTPTVGNATGSQAAKDASTTGRRPDGSKATVSLSAVARTVQAALWPTPVARDHKDGQQSNVPTNGLLGRVAWPAGWPTPTCSDAKPPTTPESVRHEIEHRNLRGVVHLAGWPTPDKSSGDGGRTSADPLARTRPSGTKKQLTINEAAQLAGRGRQWRRSWATRSRVTAP